MIEAQESHACGTCCRDVGFWMIIVRQARYKFNHGLCCKSSLLLPSATTPLPSISHETQSALTMQIQVATIEWSFKMSNATVKVEVWDVVDVALRPKESASRSNSPPTNKKYDAGPME